MGPEPREPDDTPGSWSPGPLRVVVLALVAFTGAGWAAGGARGGGLSLSLEALGRERIWTLLTYPFAPAPLVAQILGLAGVLGFGSLLAQARGAHGTVRFVVWTVLTVGLCALVARGADDTPFSGWLGVGLACAIASIFPRPAGRPGADLWAAGYAVAAAGVAGLEGGAFPTHLVGLPVGFAFAFTPACARLAARRLRGWRLEREIHADLQARERIDELLSRLQTVGGWDHLPARDRRALRAAARRVAVPSPREPALRLPAGGAAPAAAREEAAAPLLQHRLDELLSKIHRSGTDSLTQDERKDLREASEWYRRRA